MEMAQHRCRICLEYCSEIISVYDQVATGVSYLDITLKLTNQLKLDGSSDEPQHICVPCASMATTAYNTKEPCEEADFKLEIEEEIITEDKVKLGKIKDENITSNCSAFSVKEEIHIINKNEQTHEASMEHVTTEEALQVYYEKPCDKTLNYHSSVVYKQEELQCDYCEYVPESLNDYTKHVEAEHADKTTKNCNYCDKSFFDTRALKDHLRNHSNTYECYDCGSKFAFKNRLAKHLKGHEQEKRHIAFKKCEAYENKAGQVAWSPPYACKICDKKFQLAASLRQHNKVAHNSDDKSCYFCAFLPKSPDELTKHITQEHADKKPWACKYCDNTYFQLKHLKQHLVIHNVFEAKHTCTVCGYKFHSKSRMVEHMIKHTTEKPFSCSKCDRKLKTSRTLKFHMKLHERGDSDTSDNETENVSKSVAQETLDTYVCKMCNREFAHHSSLRRHSEDMHYVQISCCYCAYIPISSNDSERHIEKDHADKKYFACDQCNGAFTSVQNLKAHLLLHGGTKNYECKICNYKCTFKSILTNHMRKHTGEKPFQCSNCGNTFKQYKTMKIHLANQRCEDKRYKDNTKNRKRAVGTSIYACKVCDKTFSAGTRVRQHTKNVHKINDTSCFFCDYVPISKNSLQKHLGKKHADMKTVSCDHCDKTFFDNFSLACHLVVHNTIVNNVCKICGCKFIMESHLIQHMIVHTAEKSI